MITGILIGFAVCWLIFGGFVWKIWITEPLWFFNLSTFLFQMIIIMPVELYRLVRNWIHAKIIYWKYEKKH